MTSSFVATIGLEIHVQLDTQTKMFCRCRRTVDAPPNSHVCPVCLGMPGGLPVVNQGAVAMGVQLAEALSCTIHRQSVFARKNYFYPDLPKGYQITQHEAPLATDGVLADPETGEVVRVSRVHLEEDAGKSIHPQSGEHSLVDFNRCGAPLAEIVTEPEFHSPGAAVAWLKELWTLVDFLGICRGSMADGVFRCDANVSMAKVGCGELGVRTELKNMNSFQAILSALEFEIDRQTEVLRTGGRVLLETRLWDEGTGQTLVMRGKEEARDYRYFDEPDLPVLILEPMWLQRVVESTRETPGEVRRAFAHRFGLTREDVGRFTTSRKWADYAFEALERAQDIPAVCNWLNRDVANAIHQSGGDPSAFSVAPDDISKLANLVESGTLSLPMARNVFRTMWSRVLPLAQCLEDAGHQESDESTLRTVVGELIDEFPDEARRYVAGKESLLRWFVGQAMRRTQGRGNPQIISQLFEKLLNRKEHP